MSVVQINLIPDIKSDFLKAQRTRRLIQTVAFLVSAVSLALVIVMFLYVNVAQRQHTNNLEADIARLTSEIEAVDDLDKLVTIQSQLVALPGLHEQRVMTSNLNEILAVLTPRDIFYDNINIDFENSKLLVNAQGSDLIAVNTYVDILKFAGFQTAEMIENEVPAEPAFTSVLTNSINATTDEIQFSVEIDFDPRMFEDVGVGVTVPDIISTRSETERPKNIFDQTESGE